MLRETVGDQLVEWRRGLERRERHDVLAKRLQKLRVTAAVRTAQVDAIRRRAEQGRQFLGERRCRHQTRAAQWAAAHRRLEAKRSRVSRNDFLRDPARHAAALGAFHAFQELSVVDLALQQERRRWCLEVVSFLPLKWIRSDSAIGDHTVTLGQVQSFLTTGVLQDDEQQNLEAALPLLVRLVSSLAGCLDVTLPFPCSGGRGFGTWVLPGALHPFTGRWYYFSVYDNICTSEFFLALRLVDEDLRWLCTQQGESLPSSVEADQPSTLQLLAQLLSAAHLGCTSVPASHKGASCEGPQVSRRGAGGRPCLASDAASLSQDGEWTVLEHPAAEAGVFKEGFS